MKKFILKTIIFVVSIIILTLLVLGAFNVRNYCKSGFKFMPINNVSNSLGFKAKLEQMKESDNYRHCTFLIAGSSMSLNNISGNIIAKRTNECVFNMSSWGFTPDQLAKLVSIIEMKSVKCIFIAFNNHDFEKGFEIDYKATDAFLNGGLFKRTLSWLNKFNIRTFTEEWTYRNKYCNRSNCYQTLNFDKTGSALLDRKGFVINDIRRKLYSDTIGFKKFYLDVENLDSICKNKNIRLILVYLPTRLDLLTFRRKNNNMKVGKVLRNKFGSSFIDMQSVIIPSNKYCDGTHLFKDGADSITHMIVDSLIWKIEIKK